MAGREHGAAVGIPDQVIVIPVTLSVGNTFVVGKNPDVDGHSVLDESDNCPFAANPDQADTDEDGTGNTCDALCVGSRTTLKRVAPDTQTKGAIFELFGTGFGPSVQVAIGDVVLAPEEHYGHCLVQIPVDSRAKARIPCGS